MRLKGTVTAIYYAYGCYNHGPMPYPWLNERPAPLPRYTHNHDWLQARRQFVRSLRQ